MLQICENIKQARVSANKTQQEMASLLDVKRSTYANWEKNTEPDMSILKSISKILSIELGELINSEMSSVTKSEEIMALKAAVHVLTLELVEMKALVTKESQSKISLEVKKMMKLWQKQFEDEAKRAS